MSWTAEAVLAVMVACTLALHQLFFSPRARQRRALRALPPTPSRQIEGGAVRITGSARGRGELLRAPVTNRPCMAFSLRIVDAIGDCVVRSGAQPFVVVDRSGEARVEPEGHVEMTLAQPAAVSLHEGTPEHARAMALIRAAGIPEHGENGGLRRFRYLEAALLEGAMVTVRGLAVRDLHPEGERDSPRQPPRVLVLRGTAAEPLRISDEPELARPVDGESPGRGV